MKLRSIGLLVAEMSLFCAGIYGQNRPGGSEPRILFQNSLNDGQQVSVVVGQRIEIRLTTIGPGNYTTPDISSPAVRFWNVAWPKLQVPGGPTQVFIFEATAEGTAVIRIPHSERNSFSITVRVRRKPGKNLPAQMIPDQANNLEWKGAWTNLLNDVRQTFTPSMHTLAAAEVNLVVANAGLDEEEVTLQVLDAAGEVLATVSRSVLVSESTRVLFVFPEGGVAVAPGKVYSIRLAGQYLFGWKYVLGGYANGQALFNGRPLLPGARSTFLFKTFGAR